MNRYLYATLAAALAAAVSALALAPEAQARPSPVPGYSRPRVAAPADLAAPGALLAGPYYTPYDSATFALKDAAAVAALHPHGGKLPLARGTDTARFRYLSLYNVPRHLRPSVAEDVALVANSLSREPLVVPVGRLVVPGTDGTLIRICLDDFGWTPEAWDLLAEQGSGPKGRRQHDPYFHVLVEEGLKGAAYKGEGGKDASFLEKWRAEKAKGEAAKGDGPAGKPGTHPPARPGGPEAVDRVEAPGRPAVRKRYLAAAPWLALEPGGKGGAPGVRVSALSALCKTRNPILRADWFVAFAMWAPRYYDFFGLGVDGKRLEADFQRMVFADPKAVEKARTDVKAVVVKSRVALANRSLLRLPTLNHALGGFYWESHDAKKAVGRSNMMQNLLREQFDAKEIIASLPNGMQAYAVSDDKGNLLDLADASIAQDFATPLQDKQVHVGRNCMGCHDTGMWFINDNVRKLSQRQIGLMIPDPKDADRVASLFFKWDMKPLTDRDSAIYDAAVRSATGRPAPAAVAHFNRTTAGYLDRDLELADVALEVGLPPGKLRPILEKAVNVDFTLTGLLQDPPEPIRRDQWESDGFPALMTLLAARRAWD